MSTIYGNPLLLGGGGVKLNIDYGTNPPSDTTKLWVPRVTAPSSVEAKYEFKFGNEQLAVDNYNYIPTQINDQEVTFNCQVDNYIYVYHYYNISNSYFQRYNMTSGIWEKLAVPTNSTTNTNPYCRGVGHLVVGNKIYMFGGRQSSSSSYQEYVWAYDTTTNTLINEGLAANTIDLYQGVWIKSGDIAYGFGSVQAGNNTVAKYDFNTKTVTNVSSEFTFDTTGLLYSTYKYYPFDAGNGIYYLLPLQQQITSDSTLPVVKVDMGNKTVSKYSTIGTLFPRRAWVVNGTTLISNASAFCFARAGITQIGSTGYIFGGQFYYGGLKPSPYIFKVNISPSGLTVDALDQYLFESSNNYAILTIAQCLDNKIYVTQNYCDGTTYRNNQTLTLYSPLDNNKLFLQTGFGNNKFNIVNDNKAKVEIAINNAFIGNSENKADETDAYLYSDNAWKNIKTGNQFYARKGDLISMDLDGNGDKTYRVLKVDGSKAMALGMDDISNSWPYNATSKTGTFDNGNTGQLYAGSDLDTYLNTTWYNTLTSAAKAAIVPEFRTQYMYQYYDAPNTPNTPTYTYQYQFNWKDSDYDNLNLTDSILVGDRNVFALDLKDIYNYFGKLCITSNELMKMWTNQTTTVSHEWYLGFAVSNKENVYCITGNKGSFISVLPTNGSSIRPAFTIDLSKIPFTRV